MSTAQHSGELVRGQRTRVLALSVAASVVVHAIVLLAFPGMGRRDAPRIEPIEVTLAKPEPPRVKPALEPAPKPPATRPEPKPRPKEEAHRLQPAAEAGVSPPAPEPPLLALPQTPLPQTPATPNPEFSVRPPEPRPDVAAAAPAAKAESAPSQPASVAKGARSDVRDATLVDSSVRYPRTAEKGRVTLKVLVTRDGRTATVNMEKSSGYANLDQHAMQAVKRWRFAPARQGSEPVEQWITVNVDY